MKRSNLGRSIWLLVFLLGFGIALFLIVQNKVAEAGLGRSEEQKTLPDKEIVKPVKVQKLANVNFFGEISVYGKVEARHSAYVSPKIAGIIEEIFVDEGDYVEKNKTILFKSENKKLEQKIRNARQNLAMAKATEKERKAYLSKAKVDLERKEKSYKRYQLLFQKQAISQEVFDNVEAAYLTAVAEFEQKEAFFNLGIEQAKQAIINLEMAERDFSDSIIVAPISGFICERLIEIGEMGQPGKAVFRIENTSELDVSAFIPAEFSECLVKNQSCAEVALNGKKLDQKLKLTYVSPVVDAKLHIFEVKCEADGASSKLRPGQSVLLKFTFNERSALAAPSDSLIKDENGWAIFVPKGSVANRISVGKGEEKNGWTEILSDEVSDGMTIITEGQAFLRNEDQIRIIE